MAAVLKAEAREVKKSMVNKLRRTGFIPAVLYGDGIENEAVSVSEPDFTKLFREVGRNGVFSLEVNNEKYPVMVYDLQYDRVKNTILHADFYKVDMNVEVDAEVPIQLLGEAPGEKDGGVTQHSLYTLNVRALPAKLPSSIEVSLEHLNIGDSILVGDLPESADYSILNNEEEAIVSVLAPSMEETESEDAKPAEKEETASESEETKNEE